MITLPKSMKQVKSSTNTFVTIKNVSMKGRGSKVDHFLNNTYDILHRFLGPSGKQTLTIS